MAHRFRVVQDGEPLAEGEPGSDGVVVVGESRFRVTPSPDGRLLVRADDGHTVVVAVAGPPRAMWVTIDGRAARVQVESAHERTAAPRDVAGDMSAPMPAAVVKVLVAPGQPVAAGTPLVVLEAMKMELPVRAARDGVVRSVACAVGQLVAPGTPLIELEP